MIVKSYSNHSKFFQEWSYGCGLGLGINKGFQEHYKILLKKNKNKTESLGNAVTSLFNHIKICGVNNFLQKLTLEV